MKLNIRNLGKIKKADIELKDLTIICGPNSSNKTWLSYLIGNMLTTIYSRNIDSNIPEELNAFVKTLLDNGTSFIDLDSARTAYLSYLQTTIKNSKETLPNYFKTDKESLSELTFTLDMSSFSDKETTDCDWTSKASSVNFCTKENKVTARLLPQNEEIDSSLKKRTSDVLFSSIVFISGLVSKYTFMKPHIISSERTGALMFQEEVDRSAILIDEVLRSVGTLEISSNDKQRFIGDLLEKLYSSKSRLPVPVSTNVADVRNIAETKKIQSRISQRNPEVIEILDRMNGGDFVVDDNEIKFLQRENGHSYTISSTSSSIKSTFLIDLIIRHKVDTDEIILIDEPELNLHPDNQRLMARLIVRLINAGVKVLITTHSDFLIREINNAIALSNKFEDKDSFLEMHDLSNTDILDGNRVSAYSVSDEGEVNEMTIGKYGIETLIFDTLINKANDFQDELLYNIEPSLFED
ncbi:AAA family ATPase [Vibrio parahaemolyticus]|nr:AAA family ATPase [Vibrio parahaemolyticus]